MTRLGLIWAQTLDGVIGADGTMPWHITEDLRHFKRTTSGAPVIMGRRTWESFPERYRPLAGRTNIVVTRSDDWADDGAVRAASVEDALRIANAETPEIAWVIGGRQIFDEVIADADLLVVTEIDAEIDGDTFAPWIPPGFAVTSTEPDTGWAEGVSGLRFRFVTHERTPR